MAGLGRVAFMGLPTFYEKTSKKLFNSLYITPVAAVRMPDSRINIVLNHGNKSVR